MPIHKPVHTVHGDLYWRFVMWPVLYASLVREGKPAWSAGSPGDASDSSAPDPIRCHAMPLSQSRGSWLFSRQGGVWFAGEGDVRPEGWTLTRLHAQRDSLAKEGSWAALALVSLVGAVLL